MSLLSIVGEGPRRCFWHAFHESVSGAGERNRTPDLLITKQLLYRLSYTGNTQRQRYFILKSIVEDFVAGHPRGHADELDVEFQ